MDLYSYFSIDVGIHWGFWNKTQRIKRRNDLVIRLSGQGTVVFEQENPNDSNPCAQNGTRISAIGSVLLSSGTSICQWRMSFTLPNSVAGLGGFECDFLGSHSNQTREEIP